MSRTKHSPYWDKPGKPGQHKKWKNQWNRLWRRVPKTEAPVIKHEMKGNTPGHY